MSIGDKNDSRYTDSFDSESFDVVYGVDSLATPAPAPMPEPEPEPMPEPDLQPARDPEPVPELEATAVVAAEPELIPEAETELVPEPELDAVAEPILDAPVETLDENVDLSDEEAEEQLALKKLEEARAEKERKKRLKIIVGSAVGCGLLAIILGNTLFKKPEPKTTVAPQVETVVRGDYEDAVNANGTLRAGTTVAVTPEVDGTIESVMVKEGQKVKKDDLLFTIKNDKLDKAIRDAEDDLTAANNAVTKAQSQVEAANRNKAESLERYQESYNRMEQQYQASKERYEAWHEQQSSIEENHTYKSQDQVDAIEDKDEKAKAQKDFDAYQSEIAALGTEPVAPSEEPTYPEKPSDSQLDQAVQDAQYSVTEAQQEVVRKQKALDDAKAEGEKRKVLAPAAGNITALGAKVGNAVAVGSTSSAQGQGGQTSSGPLVQISDVSQMNIDVEVNEIDIRNIKRGMPAKATFSAAPGVEVDATVAEIATVPSNQPSGGSEGGQGGGGVVTYHVSLVVPRPNDKLREGYTASVRILTTSVRDALIVPSEAVVEDASGYSVQVIVNPETNETETRSVQIGEHNDLQTVIKEGLVEGEQLLVSADAPAGEEVVAEVAPDGRG